MLSTQIKPPDSVLFAALPPLIGELARQGTVRRYRANTTLITEGERGETVFVILSGTLRIFCSDDTGHEITLALYGPGEYVGEMSLDGGLRSANVVTETACICSVIGGAAFVAHLNAHPAFCIELIRRLIGRARLATESARGLALLDAYGRLVRLFDLLAVSSGDGRRIVAERLTHLAIARRIGCTRELVSRILKDLETGGYLKVEDRRYVLIKKLPSKW